MIHTIRSIAELKIWLKKQPSGANWHARIGIGQGKCLWLSKEPRERFTSPYGGEDELPLYPVKLPDVADAREWWWKIWEGEIVSFRYNEGMHMVCVAKGGTWDSVAAIHVTRGKHEWKVISESRFRKIVGTKTFHEMIDEVQYLGIAVRSSRPDPSEARCSGSSPSLTARQNRRAQK